VAEFIAVLPVFALIELSAELGHTTQMFGRANIDLLKQRVLYRM
jgi:hypothetical protein